MSCILFIGYGNPLRGDDGFGWQLAQKLKEKLRACEIEVIAAHQLTPELAEPISHAKYVIFADATVDADPGGLCLRKLPADDDEGAHFSHELSPQGLLCLAQTLYGSRPQTAFLLTAQAYELGYQDRLSPEMQVELEDAVDRVTALSEFLSPGLFSRLVVTRF
jgi:hydrogenase maturation protease